MSKTKSKNATQSKLNKSLNSHIRRKQSQNIELENAKMLKRLQEKKSSINTNKLSQDWRKNKYVIRHLSNYPFIMSDRNKKSKRTSSSMLPPPHSLEIFKVKVIDGVSFLVTIRLDS